MRFIIRVVVNAFAIWVVTLIPALTVSLRGLADCVVERVLAMGGA